MLITKYDQAWVNYNPIREIGQDGKNSRTFLIHDVNLDAQLVLKRIPKDKLQKDAYFAEAQALHRTAHTHIVPVRYACEDTEHIFIAMPYFVKGSLKDLLRTRHLTVREIIGYSTQLLAGLHHIHTLRYIHFDVKPDNILFNDNGEIMLSDFGLARHMSIGGDAEPETFYSKHTPPEDLARPRRLTKQCDVFQAGLTMYRMCNGEADFYEQLAEITPWPPPDRDHALRFKQAITNGRFPDRRTFLDHIPVQVRKVIVKCLELDPGKRYGSALDVANALASIEGAQLDWNYINDNGVKRWTKSADGKEYILELGLSKQLTARKRTSKTNNQIREYCKNNATSRDVQKFLRTY